MPFTRAPNCATGPDNCGRTNPYSTGPSEDGQKSRPVALGLLGAALLSNYMTTLLYNVRPTDPTVYAAVSLVLIAVALLASYLPARRAARIDPLLALRDE